MGHYQVSERIATGGFASVWSAVDTRSGRPVALKVLHPKKQRASKKRGPTAADRFLREAALLSQIRHPGIVEVLEVVDMRSTGGFIAYAMEIVEGSDLSALVDHLDLAVLLEIFARTAEALDHVHGLGVVHRDVKMQNIVVCDPPEDDPEDRAIKLIDFGVAKELESDALDDVTATGVFVGTVATAAPECFQRLGGKGVELTPQADQWSLGVTMFQALSGSLPFDASFAPDLVRQIRGNPTPELKLHPRYGRAQIPASLQRLVRRCLEKSPEDRYRGMSIVAAAIRAVSADLGEVTDRRRFAHLMRGVPTSVDTRRIDPSAADTLRPGELTLRQAVAPIGADSAKTLEPGAGPTLLGVRPGDPAETRSTPARRALRIPGPVVAAVVGIGAVLAFLLGRLTS